MGSCSAWMPDAAEAKERGKCQKAAHGTEVTAEGPVQKNGPYEGNCQNHSIPQIIREEFARTYVMIGDPGIEGADCQGEFSPGKTDEQE